MSTARTSLLAALGILIPNVVADIEKAITSQGNTCDCPILVELATCSAFIAWERTLFLPYIFKNTSGKLVRIAVNDLDTCIRKITTTTGNEKTSWNRYDDFPVRPISDTSVPGVDIPAGSFVKRRVFLMPEVRLPLETYKSKSLAARAEVAFNVVTDSTTHLYKFHTAPFTLRYAAPDDVDNKLNAELKRLKKSGPDYDSEQYLFEVENIIKRYASHPLATPLCRDYLTASQTILHDYKTRRSYSLPLANA